MEFEEFREYIEQIILEHTAPDVDEVQIVDMKEFDAHCRELFEEMSSTKQLTRIADVLEKIEKNGMRLQG